ncbi:MAG: tRNA-dihydrouridine synthase [Planctomycetota bacterium]|nr:MAG: tRNA-dihydrouridine synthase [Planctomycetota bacterium]
MSTAVHHPVGQSDQSRHASAGVLPAGPIQIGPRRIPTRFFLAPLAGYTHWAFRVAVRELGGLGLATTDLVQATLLLSGRPKSLELIHTSAEDRPLSVQIYSGNPDELVRAARHLEQRGYRGIDINMGCPMAKINGQGGGARLMCRRDAAVELVARVVDSVRIPVTVKMRLGWDREHINAPELAAAFESVGVAAVTIHGRTRQQGFTGRVDLPGIRAVVQAVRHIPVVANGDIRTVADAQRMFAQTGCAAIAIGRGAILDPWLFRRLFAAANGHPHDFLPAVPEKIAFLRRHFQLMARQHGEYACVLFRKFAAWYGATLAMPEDLEARFRRLASFAEFDALAEEAERRHGQRRSPIATALIKVPNGPCERW